MKLEYIVTGQSLSGIEPALIVAVIDCVPVGFRFAEKIGGHTRHLPLMTATPHNGKEEDFQLFLSLLDFDRFYGKFRDGAHKVDTSDLIRRMGKEELREFDGTLLFPERKAYTVNYTRSALEPELYQAVTEYVKTEMGKAEVLHGARKGSVDFALTAIQRRLESSPEAIYQSLRRRRLRRDERLREAHLLNRGRLAETVFTGPTISDNDDLNADEQENSKRRSSTKPRPASRSANCPPRSTSSRTEPCHLPWSTTWQPEGAQP